VDVLAFELGQEGAVERGADPALEMCGRDSTLVSTDGAYAALGRYGTLAAKAAASR
jgi:hypothetical protein